MSIEKSWVDLLDEYFHGKEWNQILRKWYLTIKKWEPWNMIDGNNISWKRIIGNLIRLRVVLGWVMLVCEEVNDD